MCGVVYVRVHMRACVGMEKGCTSRMIRLKSIVQLLNCYGCILGTFCLSYICAPGEGQVVSCCEHSNKPLGDEPNLIYVGNHFNFCHAIYIHCPRILLLELGLHADVTFAVDGGE